MAERVKNPNPAPEVEPIKERIKSGAPGSPLALSGDPEPSQEEKPAKKASPKKSK